MALFESNKGYFEVTAVSFSPNVITIGEETAYNITIKNVSGKKITRMYMCMSLYYPDAAGRISHSTDVYMFGGPAFASASTSWAVNDSKTFTGKFKFTTPTYETYLPNITTRLMPVFEPAEGSNNNRGMRIHLVCGDTIFADGTNNDIIHDVRGVNSEYLAVIDARYTPTIVRFEGERCDANGALNDEGLAMLTQIALSNSKAANPDVFSLKAYFHNELAPDAESTEVDLTNLKNSALDSEIQTVLTAVTLDTNADYTVTLRFGDEYESSLVTVMIPKAFANVHLSGRSTGGVCFGGFSQAVEGKPLFQCYYPSHFYAPVEFHGGIVGVNDYSPGETDIGGKWFDGEKTYKVFRSIFVFKNISISDGTQTIELGTIADFDEIDTVIEFSGTLRHGSEIYPLPRIWSTSAGTYSIDINAGKIRLRTIDGSGPANIFVQLIYTKKSEEVV